jgi:hypothetical protein
MPGSDEGLRVLLGSTRQSACGLLAAGQISLLSNAFKFTLEGEIVVSMRDAGTYLEELEGLLLEASVPPASLRDGLP